MKAEQLKLLYEAMVEGNFNQLKIERGPVKVKMSRTPGIFLADQAEESSQAQPENTEPEQSKSKKVLSEHIGVFSFGKKKKSVGMPIKQGEILGSIKGISHQDNVVAPLSGKITSVGINEGTIAEFGMTLFEILPEEMIEEQSSEI
ncbi:MAG: hypothetical protein HQM08_16260 [Candidatus Riflebacteria bacterium]|nr:hypothetical protein [Candidatus Riflebacteria bacterium]